MIAALIVLALLLAGCSPETATEIHIDVRGCKWLVVGIHGAGRVYKPMLDDKGVQVCKESKQ